MHGKGPIDQLFFSVSRPVQLGLSTLFETPAKATCESGGWDGVGGEREGDLRRPEVFVDKSLGKEVEAL